MPTPPCSGSPPWWEAAFGPDYVAVYAHRDDTAAGREVAFAMDVLALAPGAVVLDAGCGAGRHARALAACGVQVIGLDRSRALLGMAAQHEAAGPYVCADLRALPFPSRAFDGIVSFFTSFGYFDDAGDRRHLAELHRVLRPGGGLLLDFLNAPRVATSLIDSSSRRVGAREIREDRAIRGGRVEKRVQVALETRIVAEWTESVRLYDRAELTSLLAAAGFATVAAYAGLSGGAWTPTADRLVLHAVAA